VTAVRYAALSVIGIARALAARREPTRARMPTQLVAGYSGIDPCVIVDYLHGCITVSDGEPGENARRPAFGSASVVSSFIDQGMQIGLLCALGVGRICMIVHQMTSRVSQKGRRPGAPVSHRAPPGGRVIWARRR